VLHRESIVLEGMSVVPDGHWIDPILRHPVATFIDAGPTAVLRTITTSSLP
jgi:hypothetical protein